MKFRTHETYYLRRGWLSKGMRYIQQKPDLFFDKNDKASDVLGIGSSMVRAFRHWLIATGLIEEKGKRKRTHVLTEFGKLVYKNDRYLEEDGTLQLLHYKLATNIDDATSWYYFFNEFNFSEFTRENFVNGIMWWVHSKDNIYVPTANYEDDFNCIVNTYLSKYDKPLPEDNLFCPLSELNLINVVDKSKKIYAKNASNVKDFHRWVILAFIMEQAKGRDEINLVELEVKKNSIGKIFNFSGIDILGILHRARKNGESSIVQFVRTGGIDVVRILEHYTFLECVDNYYRSISY